MRIRAVYAVGALIVASLVVASLAGAASPFKRHTVPVGAPTQVATPDRLSGLFPAEWRVSTGSRATGQVAMAVDPVHTTVRWSVAADVEPKGTTLASMRQTMLGWAGTPLWGKGTPMKQKGGDTYLTLPMGKVWRYTLALIPPKSAGGGATPSYWRIYVLDRSSVLQKSSGAEEEIFYRFEAHCRIDECRTHNGQLATIMQSLRLMP